MSDVRVWGARVHGLRGEGAGDMPCAGTVISLQRRTERDTFEGWANLGAKYGDCASPGNQGSAKRFNATHR
jgi:hypothetical protein